MSRGFLTLPLVLTILLTPSFAVGSGYRDQERDREYGEFVQVAVDAARIGDKCLSFVTYISSDEFFRGLRRERRGNKVIFRRKGQQVEYFPRQIAIDIVAEPIKCRAAGSSQSAEVDWNFDDLARSLQIEVQWKEGAHTKNAEIVHSAAEPEPWTEINRRWWFQLVVKSEGVPLEQSMVVTILRATGQRMTRFSFRL